VKLADVQAKIDAAQGGAGARGNTGGAPANQPAPQTPPAIRDQTEPPQ
jgi:hypothetical protein